MKILNSTPSSEIKIIPWWVGEQVTCRNCGVKLELEVGDSVGQTAERTPNGKVGVIFNCPSCKHRITLWKPHAASRSPIDEAESIKKQILEILAAGEINVKDFFYAARNIAVSVKKLVTQLEALEKAEEIQLKDGKYSVKEKKKDGK